MRLLSMNISICMGSWCFAKFLFHVFLLHAWDITSVEHICVQQKCLKSIWLYNSWELLWWCLFIVFVIKYKWINVAYRINEVFSPQFLKAQQKISKKRCFENYCQCQKACQFSAFWDILWQSYLETLTIDDKYINKHKHWRQS